MAQNKDQWQGTTNTAIWLRVPCSGGNYSLLRGVLRYRRTLLVGVTDIGYWGVSLDTVKVKCTLVQALRLCTGRTAHRGSRGTALLYRH
jgi:hypothetical protein